MPFVLLASRPEDGPADAEYEAFLKFGGLRESELVRIRLEQDQLTDFDVSDYAGILISGSPFMTSDPPSEKSPLQQRVERELAQILDEVVERDFPFFGACYGVGTLGIHQGGVVDGTYAEEVSAVQITISDAGHRDPLLTGLPEQFMAYVGHKEALREPPPNATVLATGGHCPVQMFRIKENLYATQFHPELDEAGILDRMAAYDGFGYYPAGEVAEVAQTLINANIGPVHQILSRFIERYR